jgi:hypothetical protein
MTVDITLYNRSPAASSIFSAAKKNPSAGARRLFQ